jgi:predicted RNA-binding protein YlqC (UPF0109 family)
MLKSVIEHVIKHLVDYPESVVVNENSTASKDIFEIKVHDADVGKVIGKEGQTIRALRMFIQAIVPQGKEIEITVAK